MVDEEIKSLGLISDESKKNKTHPTYSSRESNVSSFLDSKDTKNLLAAHHLFNYWDMDLCNTMSPYGFLDPWYYIGDTKEYVFFTRPKLNLFASSQVSNELNPGLAKMPYFQYVFKNYRDIMKQLCYGIDGDYGAFSNILFNFRKSNVDVTDKEAKEQDTAENIHGFKMQYRRTSMASDENVDFSINFGDDVQMQVYNLLKIYDEYENAKFLGAVYPPGTETNAKGLVTSISPFTANKTLHDQIAIYKFIVTSDLRLLYWAKWWGVYIKNLPRSVFSDMPEDGKIQYSVQFHAAVCEDMDPTILAEFNQLALLDQYTDDRNLDADGLKNMNFHDQGELLNANFASAPVVVSVPNPRETSYGSQNRTMFKLKWRW